MKCTIIYRVNGQTFTVNGNKLDDCHRQMQNANGEFIHKAGGRLSMDALLKRCKKHNISLEFVGNGEDILWDTSEKPEKPTQLPSNTDNNNQFNGKFMQSKYNGICVETGNSIERGHWIFYAGKKQVYCHTSNMFVDKMHDNSILNAGQAMAWYNAQNTDNQQDKPASIPAPLPSNDVPKTEKKPEKVTVKPPQNGNPIEQAIFDYIQPIIQGIETNVDENKVKELIKAEMDGNKQEITVIINDKENGTEKRVDGQHMLFSDILIEIECRNNICLVGPAGSFKSHTAHEVAKALDLNFYAMSVGPLSTQGQFFGFIDANGQYIRTPFRDAFEHGGIFLLDEMDAGNASVLTSINMALSNGSTAFPDGMIEKHPDFIVIGAANTYGNGADRQYVGRQQLDAATLDRFGFIDWPYDSDLEMKLAPNKQWCAYVQKVRANVEKLKMRYVVSPRATFDGGKVLNKGMALDRVKAIHLFKSMRPQDIEQVAKGIEF